MADQRSKADKMRSVANAASAAPAERAFAKAWLAEHNEPLHAPGRPHYIPPVGPRPSKAPFGSWPEGEAYARDVYGFRSDTTGARMSDQERRRRDAREEAEHRRQAARAYAAEQGHVRGKFFDADAFTDGFAQSFNEGFEEELRRSGGLGYTFDHRPPMDQARWHTATPETARLRREEARMAREAADAQRAARNAVRDQAKAEARDRLDRARRERDRLSAEKIDELRAKPRIDYDEAGNPIYRRGR